MNKKTIIQLFLGLIEAQASGAIVDTLWMGGGCDGTIWETLIAALPELESQEDVMEAFYLGDDSKIEPALRALLAKEGGK